MKRLPLYTALLLSVSISAYAQGGLYDASTQPVNAASEVVMAEEAVSPMEADIAALQKEWARIKYQVSDKDMQLNAIHRLETQAASVSAKYPGKAEPKIWEGIILSTDAGIVKGLSALGKVEKAKKLFEISLRENPVALDGSAHTSLGSLYYQVPGWPIGFGDDDEAEKHLKKAIQLNPNGIDSNFFYGDFLLQDDRYEEAKIYLSKALQAPDRPNRPLADAGQARN
jgi:tetratricopeptide (TPR) repeat protein